mgnify:FL=1
MSITITNEFAEKLIFQVRNYIDTVDFITEGDIAALAERKILLGYADKLEKLLMQEVV